MIIISLAGPQILPNLFAIRHYGSDISKHFTLCDNNPKNQQSAELIQKICQGNGIHSTIVTTNLNKACSCYDACCQIIEENPGQTVILNTTCSLKTAALGAFMATQKHKQHAIYVNGQHIQHIHHFENQNTTEPLKTHLNVHDYIQAYGFTINSHPSPSVPSSLGHRFGNMLFNTKDGVSTWIASTKKKSRAPQPPVKDWLAQHNLLKENGAIIDSHSSWYSGYWFEYWVAHHLKKHLANRPNVSEILSSFIVSKNAINEIDIAFVHNNILHLIECKSGDPSCITQEGLRFSGLAETIGGTYTKCAVLFLRAASDSVKERAKDTPNLHYIDDIQSPEDLCKKIEIWLEKSNF